MQTHDVRGHHVVTRHGGEVVYSHGLHALPGVNRREVTAGGCTTATFIPATAPSVPPSATPSSWKAVQTPAHRNHGAQGGSPMAYNAYYAQVRTAGELRNTDSQSRLRPKDDSNSSNMQQLAPSSSYSFLPVTRTPQVTWRALPAAPMPSGQRVEHMGDGGELLNGHQVGRQSSASGVVPGAQLPTPRQRVAGAESRKSEDVKFEDIHIVESLGSGEFGHVFRGSWRGQEVAVKQLFWDGSCKTDTLQELRREVESFRNLKHSRLVKFVGACFEPPHLCLLTEYMPYGSLYHALHVTKLRFPFRNACNMSLQLAEGVTFLHSQIPIVVHRDLKSLNVVLDMHFNIKICDFGLTEIMDRTHITKKNNGGSPRYMAPELFDKKSKITEKIDVWAMGCIFSEIFGGKIPYAGVMDLPDLTRNILLYKKLPEIPNNENCPAEVQKVIAGCLTYEGELRPRSKDIFDRLRQVKKMYTPK